MKPEQTQQKTVIPPEVLEWTPEPFPEKNKRPTMVSRYDAIFKKAQPNCRLKCPLDCANNLRDSFKRWLRKNGHSHFSVRAISNCGDGFGGVWLIPSETARITRHWLETESDTEAAED